MGGPFPRSGIGRLRLHIGVRVSVAVIRHSLSPVANKPPARNNPNLQALINAITSVPPTLNEIFNKKVAYGLMQASAAGIPTTYPNLLTILQEIASRKRDADLADFILKEAPDVVVCGLDAYSPPACLGPLVGARIERAFEAWEKGEIQMTGVMAHHVHAVDRGEPL